MQRWIEATCIKEKISERTEKLSVAFGNQDERMRKEFVCLKSPEL